MSYQSEIRDFIINNFLYGDSSGLDEKASLSRQNIIDSTGVVELVAFLENHFNIHIEDHELTVENLDSLGSIDEFLRKKIQAA